jgi:hypothetical protein
MNNFNKNINSQLFKGHIFKIGKQDVFRLRTKSLFLIYHLKNNKVIILDDLKRRLFNHSRLKDDYCKSIIKNYIIVQSKCGLAIYVYLELNKVLDLNSPPFFEYCEIKPLLSTVNIRDYAISFLLNESLNGTIKTNYSNSIYNLLNLNYMIPDPPSLFKGSRNISQKVLGFRLRVSSIFLIYKIVNNKNSLLIDYIDFFKKHPKFTKEGGHIIDEFFLTKSKDKLHVLVYLSFKKTFQLSNRKIFNFLMVEPKIYVVILKKEAVSYIYSQAINDEVHTEKIFDNSTPTRCTIYIKTFDKNRTCYT